MLEVAVLTHLLFLDIAESFRFGMCLMIMSIIYVSELTIILVIEITLVSNIM